MKILVTGATGFVGGAITRYFAKKGHEIVACGRSTKSRDQIERHGTFLQWNIKEKLEIPEVDVCIHAAGLADDQASYKTLYNANANGTQHVIDSVGCRKFVYISSSSVYDFTDSLHYEDERINKRKLGNYGRTKYEGEQVLFQHINRYDSCTILRPRIVYGKGDRLLIPRLIEQSSKGKIKVPGDLQITTSACNIKLLLQVIEEIIDKHSGFDVFNVVDSQTYTMKSLFSEILNKFYGKEIEFTHLPLTLLQPLATACDLLPWKTALSSMAVRNLSRDKILSTKKLASFLGDHTNHNFYNDVESIVTWYQKATTSNLKKDNNLAWTTL